MQISEMSNGRVQYKRIHEKCNYRSDDVDQTELISF